MLLASLSLVSLAISSATALVIPFRRQQLNASSSVPTPSKPTADDIYQFTNLQDSLYVGTVYLDGNPYEVQLDTGSSDLWVDTSNVTFKSVVHTNVSTSVLYGDRTVAQGEILLANATFGNWSVPDQAFISAAGTNATTLGDKGILGLGPPSLSEVDGKLNGTGHDGGSFLERLFTASPELPNHITVLLNRSFSGKTDGGDFTVSTVSPGYENITQTPHLDVLFPDTLQTWSTNMTGMMINGTMHTGHSGLYKNGDNTVANIDSGTTQALAPQHYVDALYKNIPGAKFDNATNKYMFSCDEPAAKVNASMVFGDNTYFVHPIDMTEVMEADQNGTTVCAGSFGVSVDGASQGFDFLLGDAFLRNAYSLFDFGTWTKAGDSGPFMQLLAVTDAKAADAEYDTLNKQRVQAYIANKSSGPIA